MPFDTCKRMVRASCTVSSSDEEDWHQGPGESLDGLGASVR